MDLEGENPEERHIKVEAGKRKKRKRNKIKGKNKSVAKERVLKQ
jgi:hypothetical protein